MSHTLNIALLAEHSIGKSSFLNALVGNIIAPTSIQRETFEIDLYQIRSDAPYTNVVDLSKTCEERHKNNQFKRKTTDALVFDQLKIPNVIKPVIKILGTDLNLDIYDFPGLNDASDKENVYLKIFHANAANIDLVLYMVDAKKPLTNTTELNQLKDIIAFKEESVKNGIYFDIAIVVNKYDNKDDEDYEELYQNLRSTIATEFTKSIQIFRFCSHKFFVHNLKTHVKKIQIPKSYSKELQAIFMTARVHINRDIKTAIIKNQPIDCEKIEIMEDLLDDINSDDSVALSIQSDESQIGDWDNLISSLHTINKNILKIRSDNMSNYICYIYYQMILHPSFTSIKLFLDTFNKIKSSNNKQQLMVDMNELSEFFIQKLFYEDINTSFDYIVNMDDKICEHVILGLAQLVLYELLQIHSDNSIYAIVKLFLSDSNRKTNTNGGEKNLQILFLAALLTNINMDHHISDIINLIDTYDIYNMTSMTNVIYRLNDDYTNVTSIKYSKPDIAILSSPSYLINEIVNNPLIKKHNNNLYKIIYFSLIPFSNLKVMYHEYKLQWNAVIQIIRQYLGDDIASNITYIIACAVNGIRIFKNSITSISRLKHEFPQIMQFEDMETILDNMI